MGRRDLLTLILLAAVAAGTISAGGLQPAPPRLDTLTGAKPPRNAIWLDSLDLTKMVQRRGTPRAGRSALGRGSEPPPLSVGGVVYEHGIGTLSSAATTGGQRAI